VYPEVEKGDGGGSGSGGKGKHSGLLYRDITARLTYTIHPSSFEIRLDLTNH
jgi:hypothetical protein